MRGSKRKGVIEVEWWGLHDVEHDELDGELCDPEDALCAWTRTLCDAGKSKMFRCI